MSEKENEDIGSLTGTIGGALAGASLGTAIMPVVGTFAGALAGGIFGSQIGRSVGGAFLNSMFPGSESGEVKQPTESGGGGSDIASQLERLGQLKAQGVITEEEFAAAKAKILGS